MNARPSQFCNQSLSIGRRISERVELLDFPEIVREMKGELRCLLRDNIRLRIVARHAAGGRAKIYRGEIKDLIRHLVLDARDAMPAGGALSILTGRVALDAEYIRTHPEVRPGNYAMLTIRDTGHRSSAATLDPLGRDAPIRKGRSLGLTACYNIIDQFGGHVCVARHASETVIKIYVPCARSLHR
jgi:signal transduction histidine kinase